MRLTRLIASTTHSERDFWARTLLGRSLLLFPEPLRPELFIRFENTGKWGLPEIYNAAIASCPAEKNLLFVHDDVFLHDLFLQHRLHEGLQSADVIGLAGSRNSDLCQPSWGLGFNEDLKPTGWQKGGRIELRGAVSHVTRYLEPGVQRSFTPAPQLGVYGNPRAECHLLDGLFLGCNAALLQEWGMRFDEQFRFHLYDLDFCRTARLRGLRLSTWPILVSHGSGGNFDSEEFRTAARLYLHKWQPLEQLAASDSSPRSPKPEARSPSSEGASP